MVKNKQRDLVKQKTVLQKNVKRSCTTECSPELRLRPDLPGNTQNYLSKCIKNNTQNVDKNESSLCCKQSNNKWCKLKINDCDEYGTIESTFQDYLITPYGLICKDPPISKKINTIINNKNIKPLLQKVQIKNKNIYSILSSNLLAEAISSNYANISQSPAVCKKQKTENNCNNRGCEWNNNPSNSESKCNLNAINGQLVGTKLNHLCNKITVDKNCNVSYNFKIKDKNAFLEYSQDVQKALQNIITTNKLNPDDTDKLYALNYIIKKKVCNNYEYYDPTGMYSEKRCKPIISGCRKILQKKLAKNECQHTYNNDKRGRIDKCNTNKIQTDCTNNNNCTWDSEEKKCYTSKTVCTNIKHASEESCVSSVFGTYCKFNKDTKKCYLPLNIWNPNPVETRQLHQTVPKLDIVSNNLIPVHCNNRNRDNCTQKNIDNPNNSCIYDSQNKKCTVLNIKKKLKKI